MGWGRMQDVLTLDGGSWEPPVGASLSKLERISGRGPIDLPLPEIPGWVARAENGRRALERVDQYEDRIAELPEADQAGTTPTRPGPPHGRADGQLRSSSTPRLWNVPAVQRLRELRSGATQTMDGFYKESLGTLESAVSDFRSAGEALLKDPTFVEAHHALNLNSQVQDAKSLASDIAEFRKAGATEAPISSRNSIVGTGSKLPVSVTKDMKWLKNLQPQARKTDPCRSAFWLSAGQGSLGPRNTMDILEMHQATRFTSDLLGDRAISLRKIKELYQKQVDAFDVRSNELEKLCTRTIERINEDDEMRQRFTLGSGLRVAGSRVAIRGAKPTSAVSTGRFV